MAIPSSFSRSNTAPMLEQAETELEISQISPTRSERDGAAARANPLDQLHPVVTNGQLSHAEHAI
jgi:hypothetical protein